MKQGIICLLILAAPLALSAEALSTAKASSTTAAASASPTAKVGAKKMTKMKHKGGVNPAAMAAKAAAKAETKTVAAKEHWVCPMHDGGESDHAGKCPKCGMDLVKE